jgi:hypothetical protein
VKPKTKAQLEQENAILQHAINELTEAKQRFNLRLRDQMKAFRIHWSGTLDQMLDSVLQHERTHTESAISGARDFRDNCLIMLKSLEVVIESVECASTHSEKNARLRGLADVIHRYQDRLGRFEFCFDRTPWYSTYSDVFQREDPRMAKLRERVAELELQLNPPPKEPQEPPF